MQRRRTVLLLALWLLAACAVPAPAAPTPVTSAATQPAPKPGAEDPITGDVVVFAAASLTDAFKEMSAAFEAAHPNARVVLSFGGSSQLAIQLINGARADVFASADQDQMNVAERGNGLAGAQHVFVRNRLMIVAPADNPAHISSLQDLARPGVKLVGAQAAVPIGAYTSTLLDSASNDPTYGANFRQRVERNLVSREDTVRQIVAKIQLGEGDAAIVYSTDVTAQIANQFVRIPLPEELQVIATYPIAVSQRSQSHRRRSVRRFRPVARGPGHPGPLGFS